MDPKILEIFLASEALEQLLRAMFLDFGLDVPHVRELL
jgi:hypothetical protein